MTVKGRSVPAGVNRTPGGAWSRAGSVEPFTPGARTRILPVMPTHRVIPRLPILLSVLAVVGCAGADPPPLPTLPAAGLAGERVLVFPVQRPLLGDDAEGEMVFALKARAGASTWILPARLREGVARSPSLSVPVDDLPVDIFFRARVERVGDPLYGMIRRAASLYDARQAIIPLSVSYRPPEPDRPGAVEVFAALVDVLTGSVVWVGIEEGAADGPGDPGGLARGMEALARRFLPAG